MVERKAVSPSKRWKILAAFGYQCQYCGIHPTPEYTPVFQIEHIIPLVMGGTDDDTNLTLACRDCNLGKSALIPSVRPRSFADAMDKLTTKIQPPSGVEATRPISRTEALPEMMIPSPQKDHLASLPAKWRQELGPVYTAILLTLWEQAHKIGVRQGEYLSIALSTKEIGALIGLPDRTLERYLSPKAFLGKKGNTLQAVLRSATCYLYEPETGRKVRAPNRYTLRADLFQIKSPEALAA